MSNKKKLIGVIAVSNDDFVYDEKTDHYFGAPVHAFIGCLRKAESEARDMGIENPRVYVSDEEVLGMGIPSINVGGLVEMTDNELEEAAREHILRLLERSESNLKLAEREWHDACSLAAKSGLDVMELKNAMEGAS